MIHRKPRIALLAVPEVAASTLYGMFDVLASAGRDWASLVEGREGESVLDPRVISLRGHGAMTIANDIQIMPEGDDGVIPDVVCVPEVAVPPGAVLTESHRVEIAWLRCCFEAGAIVATSCSGALLLAETGLLNGVEATTHWAYCDALASYPGVQVFPKRALVVGGEGGRLVMAGGGTSWEDLALYLVARLVSVDEAMQIAKLFPAIQSITLCVTRSESVARSGAQLTCAPSRQPRPMACVVAEEVAGVRAVGLGYGSVSRGRRVKPECRSRRSPSAAT